MDPFREQNSLCNLGGPQTSVICECGEDDNPHYVDQCSACHSTGSDVSFDDDDWSQDNPYQFVGPLNHDFFERQNLHREIGEIGEMSSSDDTNSSEDLFSEDEEHQSVELIGRESLQLDKLHREMSSTDNMIPLEEFSSYVKYELGEMKNVDPSIEISEEAIRALQAATEEYAVRLFNISQRLACHAGKQMLRFRDLVFAQQMIKVCANGSFTGDWSWGSTPHGTLGDEYLQHRSLGNVTDHDLPLAREFGLIDPSTQDAEAGGFVEEGETDDDYYTDELTSESDTETDGEYESEESDDDDDSTDDDERDSVVSEDDPISPVKSRLQELLNFDAAQREILSFTNPGRYVASDMYYSTSNEVSNADDQSKMYSEYLNLFGLFKGDDPKSNVATGDAAMEKETEDRSHSLAYQYLGPATGNKSEENVADFRKMFLTEDDDAEIKHKLSNYVSQFLKRPRENLNDEDSSQDHKRRRGSSKDRSFDGSGASSNPIMID